MIGSTTSFSRCNVLKYLIIGALSSPGPAGTARSPST